MKKISSFLLMTLLLGSMTHLAIAQEKIAVWPNGPAVENGMSGKTEIVGTNISNNAEALLYYYPVKDSKCCVLICPGGGYHNLSYINEGSMVAEMFNAKGISAAVLHYRMPNGNSTIPISDVREAMKIVRKRMPAETKLGIIGFSAGGHLASTAITHLDTTNVDYALVRPDFGILVYPVITMEEKTHKGSRENLLGKNPTDAQVAEFSNQLRVTKNTPPTIIFYTTEDKTVPVINGVLFYEALLNNKVPAELHIYAKGKHGFGMKIKNLPSDAWPETLNVWMKDMGFLK
jgi:acetyl esterase/lipase